MRIRWNRKYNKGRKEQVSIAEVNGYRIEIARIKDNWLSDGGWSFAMGKQGKLYNSLWDNKTFATEEEARKAAIAEAEKR